MWQTESTCNPTRTFTPDSVTTYDYDYDNRLITVNLPTNNDTVEYTYDATGRRLTKEFTYHNGANTDVTIYKYHYIGSQITEIEIDSIRNPGEGQSVLRNEEVKIHLGANSQPISYEWVKHVGESTTQATYYYHYDIHGNVLKVTDSSENVKITYTYDTLGTILTETNPDSILNFFTFRGASQTIWEPETGLYYSGGYYRPDTGTALQGTGAPVLTNPSSGAMLNAIALATSANAQLASHAMISVATAGSTGGGTSGGFSPPSGPADGMSKAGKQRPSSPVPLDPSVDFAQAYCIAPKIESEAEKFGIVVNNDPKFCINPWLQETKVLLSKEIEHKDEGEAPEDPQLAVVFRYFKQVTTPVELTDDELDLIAKKEGVKTKKEIDAQRKKEKEEEERRKKENPGGGESPSASGPSLADQWEKERKDLRLSVQWAIFGYKDGKLSQVVGYCLSNKGPKFYYGGKSNNIMLKGGDDGDKFVSSWSGYTFKSKNFTGGNLVAQFFLSSTSANGKSNFKTVKFFVGTNEEASFKAKSYSMNDRGTGASPQIFGAGKTLIISKNKPGHEFKYNAIIWEKNKKNTVKSTSDPEGFDSIMDIFYNK